MRSLIILAMCAAAGCHRAPRQPAPAPAPQPIIVPTPAPIIVPIPIVRPRLLLFTATWCAPCRELHGVMADPRVRKALDAYALETIDIDRNKDTVHQYKVSAVPTLVVIGVDGNETKRTQGMKTPQQLAAWLGH